MTVLETATGVQDQVLDAIKTSQDALLAAVKAVAENTTPLTDKLPAAPFASQLPDGTNVINTAFGFAEKLLANQKEFTTKLIETYSPAKSAPNAA
jgi:hypothetical protein